jgi:Transposase DDE domain
MEHQLIQLYVWVCTIYDKHSVLKLQRLSNNNHPAFTDQELITVYLFGHLQGHFQQRRIYDYIRAHWLAWFPDLPSYQAFNYRLNLLSSSFALLLEDLLSQLTTSETETSDHVIDSLPIILAKATRANTAKVARELANKGYCSTKKLYYHGLKLHLLGRRRPQQLPLPEALALTAASVHDLTAFRQEVEGPAFGLLFADKAYKDEATKAELAKRQVELCTPDKCKPGQEKEKAYKSLWSRFVSAMRQPIESMFNWLIQRSGLQEASKVRSTNGLLVHCYGKLTVCCFRLLFNS